MEVSFKFSNPLLLETGKKQKKKMPHDQKVPGRRGGPTGFRHADRGEGIRKKYTSADVGTLSTA